MAGSGRGDAAPSPLFVPIRVHVPVPVPVGVPVAVAVAVPAPPLPPPLPPSPPPSLSSSLSSLSLLERVEASVQAPVQALMPPEPLLRVSDVGLAARSDLTVQVVSSTMVHGHCMDGRPLTCVQRRWFRSVASKMIAHQRAKRLRTRQADWNAVKMAVSRHVEVLQTVLESRVHTALQGKERQLTALGNKLARIRMKHLQKLQGAGREKNEARKQLAIERGRAADSKQQLVLFKNATIQIMLYLFKGLQVRVHCFKYL